MLKHFNEIPQSYVLFTLLQQYGVSLAHSTEWPILLGKLEFTLTVIIITNTKQKKKQTRFNDNSCFNQQNVADPKP